MPRPQTTGGLHVSVSQVKTWLRCPRLFELRYVRGATPEFVPQPLVLGTAIHEALAGYYGELRATGAPLPRDLLEDVFRASLERAFEGAIPVEVVPGEEPGHLVDVGVRLLGAFYAHAAAAPPCEVEAVEQGFAVPVHDPGSGELLEETLVGTVDLVIREAGRRIVVEHKTASRRYGEEELRFDGQLAAYKLAARSAGLGEVGLRYQVLTKTRTAAVQVADVERTAADEEDFLRVTAGVLRAIDAGVSFPVRSTRCVRCPYREACRP